MAMLQLDDHPDNCGCAFHTGRLKAPDRVTSKAALSAGNADAGATGPRKRKRPLTRGEIKKALGPKERNVSKSIESQLNGLGIWNTRTQSGAVPVGNHYMQLCRPGTPDRIAAIGLHVWIEVKRPGEVARADQLATIEQLKANGSLAFVLDDPTDLDFVLQGLRDHAGDIMAINKLVADIQRDIDAAVARNAAARKVNK